jgi:hypothetical protein
LSRPLSRTLSFSPDLDREQESSAASVSPHRHKSRGPKDFGAAKVLSPLGAKSAVGCWDNEPMLVGVEY